MEAECPCGSCAVEVNAEAISQLYCHCGDCQASAGAPYVARALFPAGSISEVKGTFKGWTYKTQERFFCSDCGVMVYSSPGGGRIHALNAALLPASAFKPQMHIQCQDAVVPIKDDLPHFAGWGPMADDNEVVGW